MKKAFAGLLFVTMGKLVYAQYKPVDSASVVQFRIKNFGFSVTGSLSGLSGRVLFDPQHLTDAIFDVSVEGKSINTDNEMRDNHLRKETYLDVEKYPRIRIVSEKITPSTRAGTFLFQGKLTIKNHTKDITFPFTADATGSGYRFKGTFIINRKEFEVGGASTISDNLEVLLIILAK